MVVDGIAVDGVARRTVRGAAPAGPKPTPPRDATIHIAPSSLSATQDMWFYEQQLRQYQDPKFAVRQKAEFRAAERQRRLTAQKWYGISNARPLAGTDPVHGQYAPVWTSGNPYRPFQWAAPMGTTVVVRPDTQSPIPSRGYMTLP